MGASCGVNALPVGREGVPWGVPWWGPMRGGVTLSLKR
jgi:hypothetical protein